MGRVGGKKGWTWKKRVNVREREKPERSDNMGGHQSRKRLSLQHKEGKKKDLLKSTE